MSKFKRCIVLLADGARPDIFFDLCNRGELPNCESFYKRNGYFGQAVSVFPSTTGPAYLPVLTGCYPGTCNVPGIRWFDKKKYGSKMFGFDRYRSYVGLESFLVNRDIQIKTPTLFELFPRSANIFNMVNKGVSWKGNKTKQSRIWYWYYAHLTDRWSVPDQAALNKLLKVIEEDLDFAFVVFPGIDEYSHLSEPDNKKTLEAYRFVDRAIGEIVKSLEKKNILDETLVVVVSDHGLTNTEKHFGVASFLEERGIKTFYYPKILKWNFEAASMVSGNGMLHLYFKDKTGWTGRTPFDLLEKDRSLLMNELLNEEAIDLMAGQNEDGSVVVWSRKGKAKISIKDERIDYQILSGKDPFSYPPLPSNMTERESLNLTFETEYPDALVQLLQVFRSERTGDLVLSASKGWDLRKRFEHPKHHSSHGGLIREQMMVPFFCNAPLPDLPVRTCDIFPTILSLLGRDIPSGIDGRDIFQL